MNLENQTIKSLSESLQKKEISSVEISQNYINRIKEHEGKIESFITLNEQQTLREAQKSDEMRAQGKEKTLTGIPCAVKDCFCTKEWESTCGSKILKGYVPPFDATPIRKLKDEGMVIIGKANTDEFTMGTTGEFSSYKTTKNPYDIQRVPGGSSSGPVAAVSCSFAPYALGTDTGGSIRLPAAFCNVTGLKNTYGRVSRYGVMSMASSLDTIGPITKTVEDAAIVMNTIAGKDSLDATTSSLKVPDYTQEIEKSVEGKIIGLPKEYFTDGTDPKIAKAVQDAIKVYESLGMKVKEVSLPHTDYALAVYYVLCPAEVSSNMSRYDGIRYGASDKEADNIQDYYLNTRTQGLGEEVKRRIMMGTYVLSSGYYDAYYKKAQQVRTLIIQDFKKVFSECDVLISPSSPMLPFKLGERMDDPISMYLADIFTVSANVAGICGLSIPCGFAEEDGKQLPIGLQIFGAQFAEGDILSVGHVFQKNTDFHTQYPTL